MSQYSCLSKRRSFEASLSKPDCPIWQTRVSSFSKNFRTSGQCNKGFKVTLDKYMSKNESIKRQSKNKASRIKHQTCYTCRDKYHFSEDYPKTQTFIHMIVNDNISYTKPKNDTSTIKMISSSYDSPHAIWVPKHLLTNHE